MADESKKEPQQIGFSVFAVKLPQKLAMTLVLAYLFNFEDMKCLLRLLCKKSQRFLHINFHQLRAFVLNKPIKQITLAFQGSGNFEQFVKPLPYTKVQQLSFAYIQNDLHTIAEFVSGSYGFGIIHMGNRGFKLFEDIDVTKIVGLSLSDITCR